MAEESVGRVSVEVVPDADNFGREADAQLKRQRIDPRQVDVIPVIQANLAALGAQMAAIAKVIGQRATINVDADVTNAAAAANVARLALGNLNARILATLDKSSWTAATTAAKLWVATKMPRAVNLGLNLAQGSLAMLNAQIVALTRGRAINLIPNLSARASAIFNASMQALTRNRQVAILPNLVKLSQAAVSASLAVLTRDRVVKVYVDTGKSLLNITSVLSGFSALRESVDEAHKVLTGLFTNLPQVAAATTGILALSGALLSSAANMAGLAGSAAQALPILLALGGVAVGFAITAAAFKDFSTVLPGVAAQVKGLQDVISKAFWDSGTGAVAGIEAFASSIQGPLTAGLQQVAGAIGGFIGNLATQLGAALGGTGGPLAAWFGSLTESVKVFEPFITNLVSIFVQFGNVGSAMLTPLAGLVGELAFRFDFWFQRLVAAQGGVEAFAAKTTSAVAGIIETVIQLGAIFGAVFSAAEESGAASFTTVADKLKGFAQTLNDNHDKMVGLFDAAQQGWANFADAAGGSVSSALSNIATLLTAVLPVIGAITGTLTALLAGIITPEVTAGLQSFVDGIAKGIEALKPAFAPLAGLIATLGPVLGTLAEVVGNVFGAMAPSITGVVKAVGPLIEKLGGGLLTIVEKLAGPLDMLAAALAEALGNPALAAAIDAIVNAFVALIPALSPIIGLAGSLVSTLLPLVATILEPLAGLLGQLVPIFTPLAVVIGAVVQAVAPLITILVNLITAVLEPILPLIVTLVESLLPLLVPIIQVLATVLQLVMALLTPLIEAILPPLVGILNVVVSVIGLVATALVSVFGVAITWIQEQILKVSEGISAFFDKWQEIWNNVASFFQGLWEGLLNWIKDLLGIHSPSTWFLDLASNMLAGMLDGLRAGWEWITGFISGALTWLKDFFLAQFNAVKDIVLGAWDAITGFFSAAWEGLKLIVSTGWRTITSFFTDALTGLKNLVSAAWTNVVDFFTGGVDNAIATVKAMPGRLIAGLGDLSGVLYQKGVDLVMGLLNGVGNMASRIGSWFLDRIPAWIKEPFMAALGIHSPSTVFRGFGENIIQGLLVGMESKHGLVFRSLNQLASGVADTQFNLPNIAGGGLSAVAAMIASTYAGQASRTLIYNNYGPTGFTAEEDLFAAAGRGRMVW